YRGDETEFLPDQPDGPTHLQLERRNGELHLEWSRDGNIWTPFRIVRDMNLPPRISLGLAVQNSTKAQYSAVFERRAIAVAPQRASPATSNSPVPAPSLAVSPFDAPQAKEHQDAWAQHFGLPVEMTNSIGITLRLIPPGKFTLGAPSASQASSPQD